ncbi:MAG: arsenic efflux protein [Lachnospiraceae bacterium]|nr:arsenic efflux protein [Lachnospiraceae bacterium]
MEFVFEILEDTFIDSVKIVPFLLVTYLAMEYLEHRMGEKTKSMLQRAGRFGPVIGGLLGVVPQCGFSAAASNLYAGRVITLGTLIAIYLSTSDEMLPILISEKANVALIVKILLAKAAIGIAAGLVVDVIYRHFHTEVQHEHIHDICEHEHCNCEKGIVRSAVRHTLNITIFIFVISLIINAVLYFVGEDILAEFILNRPLLGPVIAGIVGLIPNCAASVALTQLYMEGLLGTGSMMAGLLVGAGIGLLVLFRVNSSRIENLKIAGILYIIGVMSGIIIEILL